MRGEMLSLVGKSGSGKTTVHRYPLKLIPTTSGVSRVDGIHSRLKVRSRSQIVFHEPGASLNPRWRVSRNPEEPHFRVSDDSATRRNRRDCMRCEIRWDIFP